MSMGLAEDGAGGRRRGRRARRRSAMADINVTPLVDVMLVLLIIFMVTAPLLSAGVPIDLPDSNAPALHQDIRSIDVAIDGSGQIWLDHQRVPAGGLAARLALVPHAQGPNAQGDASQVTLRADRRLDYGRVVAVMGELNAAGFHAISLVTNAGAVTP